MGRMSTEPIEFASVDELINYLRANHAIYMSYGNQTYYITDANDIYWRAQDTNTLNDKGHFVDCSELIPVVTEFVNLPFRDGKSIVDMFDRATFYRSVKIDGQGTPVPII